MQSLYLDHFGITIEEIDNAYWQDGFFPGTTGVSQSIVKIAGATGAISVVDYFDSIGYDEYASYLRWYVNEAETFYDEWVFATLIILPLSMVISMLLFSIMLSSPSTSFTTTFALYFYFIFFWNLLFNIPFVLLAPLHSTIIGGWIHGIVEISLIVLSTCHMIWFFMRSNEKKLLLIMGAWFVSAVIYFAYAIVVLGLVFPDYYPFWFA